MSDTIVIHEDVTGAAPACCRFTAICDDTYEAGSTIGYGATPAEAIADLLEIMEAEGDITVAEQAMLWATHRTRETAP